MSTRSRRSKGTSRAGSRASAADAKYDALHTKLQSAETRLQSMIGENETLKRDNTRLRKMQRERVNLNVLDDESGASDAKVIALQNLHSQKIRALMKSIEKYKVEVKKLSSQNRESSRSRQIQGLQNQLRSAELVSDVLKETLTTSSNPMSPEEVNDLVIRKTLGGPKRFRPKSREELQNQVQDLELKYKRIFARAETTKIKLREEQENSRQLTQSLSSKRMEESKSSASSYGSKEGKESSVGEKQRNHGARVVELLSQLEEMRAQTEVKDRQIRMYVSKVENLHESKRELLGYKDKYERSKSKNTQQLEEIEKMHQEAIQLRRKLEREKETALRWEAEVDVQKEQGMAANQDVGRQRLKDMQKISELTEDLEEVRSKLIQAEKAASKARQKRLRDEQTLETTMSSLKSKMEILEKENKDLIKDKFSLQQKLDREKEESQRQIQSTTSTTKSKITEQERKIQKLTLEKDSIEKDIVRYKESVKNLESQLDRSERSAKDRIDKLEILIQKKDHELRELDKERGELEFKQADARRTAKEIESRGESGMKAANDKLNELKSHLDEEIIARKTLQDTLTKLQKALTAAKIKNKKLEKMLEAKDKELQQLRRNTKSGGDGGGGQNSRSGGPAARTPKAKGNAVVEESDDDSMDSMDDEDHDAIMNA
jgi:hypothetical protein